MNKQSKDGIIRLKKEGLRNAEIAKNLNLKLATVIHYITLIRKSDDCPEWFRQSLNEHRKRIDDAIEDIMKELDSASIYLGENGCIGGYVQGRDIMLDCTKIKFTN